MAGSQLLLKREPSKVIQGTRRQIATELDKLGEDVELTLIVPGKEIESKGGSSSTKRKSFEEVFGPLQQGFEESGMTEAELLVLVDSEMTAYRAERRAKAQNTLG